MSVSNADDGKRARIKSFMLREAASAALSAVMGMRGRRIAKIATSPIKVKSNAEATVTAAVHMPVFKIIFDSRNLLTAVIAVKKISGTTIYLPNLTITSVIKASAEDAASEVDGTANESAAPSSAPIKYLSQSFIVPV